MSKKLKAPCKQVVIAVMAITLPLWLIPWFLWQAARAVYGITMEDYE